MNLASMGIDLERSTGDRDDVPIDFRFLDLLLRAAEDPEVGIGNFAKGVRVGPGVRMPRLPALYKRKKKWRLASQADPRNYLEDEEAGGEHTWRRNYSSLDELSDKVIDVLEDQSKRGQILKLSEAEAKRQYPNLVVASLGANKKGQTFRRTSLTDNRGNGALLNKLMTTKFPASALLMELSTYVKRMNMRTVVEWAPRDCNREADQLAKGIMT